MSVELVYTSIARGLKPGSSGFCTAAATAGMSRQVITKLEMLSGYEFHFDISDPNANLNPVNYAHTQLQLTGQISSVLSRIGFAGADYSGRTNKIAHHFLLRKNELLPGGPAWMMQQMVQQDIYCTEWKDAAQELPSRSLDNVAKSGDPAAGRPAAQWQRIAGDAGWAGKLVEAFRKTPKIPAYVIFKPGTNLLALFAESMAILQPAERWQVLFSTYYTALPAGCYYHWRGIAAGSKAIKEIQRFSGATVIDLTKKLPDLQDNPYVQAARAGQVLAPARDSAPKVDIYAAPKKTAKEEDEDITIPLAPLSSSKSRARVSVTENAPAYSKVPITTVETFKNTTGMKILAASLAILVVALLISNVWTFLILKDLRNELVGQKSSSQLSEKDNSSTQTETTIEQTEDSSDDTSEVKEIVPPEFDYLKPYPRKILLEENRFSIRKIENRRDRIFEFNVGQACSFVELPLSFKRSVAETNTRVTIAWPQKSTRYKENYFVYDVMENQLTIKCKQIWGGIVEQDLLNCHIEGVGQNRRLVCYLDEKASNKEDYKKIIKQLVIELVDEDNKVYQCPLRDYFDIKNESYTRKLNFSGNGNLKKPNSVSIDYPWPETLTLKNDRSDGKMDIQAIEFSWNDPNNLTCKIELDTTNDPPQVFINITGATNCLEKAAQDLWNEKDTLSNKYKYADKLFDLTRKAFENNGSAKVIDAWGVPVAFIDLEFPPPRKQN